MKKLREKDVPTLDWDKALRERLPKHPKFAVPEEFRMSLFFLRPTALCEIAGGHGP
jgi:hypothetical protein